MKKSLFIFCPLLLVTAWISISKSFKSSASNIPSASSIVSCAPGADDIFVTDEFGKFIPVMPGRGDFHYAVSARHDSAQFYFDQGLTMYFSYHMKEAIASFKEAARFDTSCLMAYWGQALAMGPTYNGGYNYSMPATVPAVLQLMNDNKAMGTTKENDLVTAMNKRYDLADEADNQRTLLNTEYARAMKQLVIKYPDDINIRALYIDAVMLLHSWDFWFNDGKPKPWTNELVQYAENILATDPQHPAGLHYYIHLTEASRQPEVALSSADSLIKLFPGIAHMVHMSSHEYERIGYYAKGVIANEAADASLVRYASLAPGLSLSPHVSHYYAVDAYCALSGAMYTKAIKKTAVLRKSVSPDYEDTYNQYLYMFPSLAAIRLGKWQDILDEKLTLDPEWIYAGILNDFALGMAYAKTNDIAKARNHLAQLRTKQQDSILKIPYRPYMSSPLECSEVAEYILESNIAFAQKKYKDALTSIKKAIAAEDKLIYSEPNTWILPARQYLGTFLLKMKQASEAEKVFREDLVWNPGNGWSLLGLHQALEAQNKTKELSKLKALYTNSFSEAEKIPATPAY